MTQRRVTATNQLSTVLDTLQLGKKTGILTVERGEGEAFEEGTITLVNGQVADAAIGSYRGRDAATKLLSWRACRFSFVPMLPGPAAPFAPAVQTEAKVVDRQIQEPMYGYQQAHPVFQNNLSRRPVAATYGRESLEAVLLTLDRKGLSRMHRRLFLLIDGKRSIEELAMLIRRTPAETMALLTDLEQAGFIQI